MWGAKLPPRKEQRRRFETKTLTGGELQPFTRSQMDLESIESAASETEGGGGGGMGMSMKENKEWQIGSIHQEVVF